MTIDPPAGLLTTGDARGVWCWVAVRIDAAAELTQATEYASLSEHERRTKAYADESAWLTRLWNPAAGTHVELRYLGDPVERRVSCAVLGRVFGVDPAATYAEAVRLRDRLGDLPHHVHGSPITDAAEVRGWLAPFAAGAGGIAEIRKLIRSAVPSRRDAGVGFYLSVEPLNATMISWEPLLAAMLSHPYPVMLTAGVESYAVPADLEALLLDLTRQYGRLAEPGWEPGGTRKSARMLPPDAFAVEAERLYRDAARRYRSHAYRLRVSVASPAALPEHLLEFIAATISPPPRRDAAGAAAWTGGSAQVVRPRPPEVADACRNLTTLGHARWDDQYVSRLPGPLPSGLRLLAQLVDAGEAGAAMRLPLAVNGTLPGFPVRRPRAVDQDAGRSEHAGQGVDLGRRIGTNSPGGSLRIALSELTQHSLIVGTTGHGKTNTALVLCEQLWTTHHIPFLVLEPANVAREDYRWLAGQPGMADMVVFTVGNEDVAPLRLNPFDVPAGVRINTHIAGLLACFDAAFGLWDPLPAIYDRALRAAYRERGIVPTDTAGPQHLGNWPTVTDFVARIRQEAEQLDSAGDLRANIIAATALRAESLAEGACGTTLDCAASYPIEDMLRRPVVIELAGVGGDEREQAFVSALLLRTMTEHYQAGPEHGALAHVTVVEDAHRLLGRPEAETSQGVARARAARSFAHTIMENRRYGEGVVLVEQVPGKLVEDAYTNTNVKVMHRLPGQDDRRLLGPTMSFTEDEERHAATLTPFTAFAFYQGLDRPALIQVPDVRGDAARAAGLDRARLPSDAEMYTRSRDVAWIEAAVAPFAECDGCEHRCMFRSRAATAVRPEHAGELVARITSYPAEAAAQDLWWRDTAAWVESIADQVTFVAATDAERRDYEACVFVHLSRRAWPRQKSPWTRLYRRAVGPATRAAGPVARAAGPVANVRESGHESPD